MSLILTSLSAFSGVLENKMTGESIEFLIDRETREVTCISRSNQLLDKSFPFSSIELKSSKDLNELMLAIMSSETVTVKNVTFRRIEKALSKL